LTLPLGAPVGIKGGWIGPIIHNYPSEMAQNFWTAIFAWTTCFLVTILISSVTQRQKTDEELKGLVYSLTPRIRDHDVPWHKQPAMLGLIVMAAAVLLNIIFW
jgi:SSS family solute:Na+ symporter